MPFTTPHAHTERTFVPAMGRAWLLPLYDTVTRLLGLDRSRLALLEQAALRPGHRVLDVGCGTGTLAVLITRRYQDVIVVALDPDAKALARAGRKARHAKASIQLDRGYADALPYPDASFDRVFSSFMLHHLEGAAKEATLREIRRVLRPGGRFHLVDFSGSAPNGQGEGSGLHAHRRLSANTEDRLLALMAQAGFVEAKPVDAHTVLRGRLRVAYFHGAVPA